LVPDAIVPDPFNGIKYGQDVITIDLHTFHSISPCLINQALTSVLFRNWCTQTVAIVFYNNITGRSQTAATLRAS
jgi:hypothetical protein